SIPRARFRAFRRFRCWENSSRRGTRPSSTPTYTSSLLRESHVPRILPSRNREGAAHARGARRATRGKPAVRGYTLQTLKRVVSPLLTCKVRAGHSAQRACRTCRLQPFSTVGKRARNEHRTETAHRVGRRGADGRQYGAASARPRLSHRRRLRCPFLFY